MNRRRGGREGGREQDGCFYIPVCGFNCPPRVLRPSNLLLISPPFLPSFLSSLRPFPSSVRRTDSSSLTTSTTRGLTPPRPGRSKSHSSRSWRYENGELWVFYPFLSPFPSLSSFLFSFFLPRVEGISVQREGDCTLSLNPLLPFLLRPSLSLFPRYRPTRCWR